MDLNKKCNELFGNKDMLLRSDQISSFSVLPIISQFSTDALLEELLKRKDTEVPRLVETINASIKALEVYGYEICFREDNEYRLEAICFDKDKNLIQYHDRPMY